LIEISLRGSQRRPPAGALRRRRKPSFPAFPDIEAKLPQPEQ
jgi:hypothetical protein